MPDPVLAALARDALVVTPNKRLARDLVARFDAAQAQIRAAWPAARALPWHAFVADLWQRALDAGLDLPPQRLDAAQAGHLWHRIVAQDAADPLFDAAGAATLAAEAWERVHAYGAGGASWRGFPAGSPEVEAFVRWANAFERETARLAALDFARVADGLAAVAPGIPGVAALDVVCAGFVEFAPQQRRLLAALAAAGARVAQPEAEAPVEVSRGRLHAAANPRDELVAAFAWARARAAAEPAAAIGIVIHDLHERRTEVRALAEDLLCPGLQWPGREAAPRPYDLSAAGTLADAPPVATALQLLALAHGPLERAEAATLLRSAWLPGDAVRRAARAGVERAWLEQGRRSLTLASLAGALARHDPDLAQRWRALPRPGVPARGTPREFVEAWRRWLEAAGWCEGVPPDAAAQAARGAFNETLAEFVRLTAVAPTLERDEALRTLRDAVHSRPFAPEAPGARIRVLGVLEAAGLAFDAVWVAGLAAADWPRAPQPNPLLPLGWQREHGVPRATPARELAYARALTARLDAAAGEVVFSYAASVDDHRNLPSPLVAHLPAYRDTVTRPVAPMRALFAAAPVSERVDDPRLPALAEGAPLRGGAGLVEAQGACPFQAGARYRLRADAWPVAGTGLKPTERGRFVHAAFAAFWREVRDRDGLAALDATALEARLAHAVAAGQAAVDAATWEALPPVVAAVETGHVARLMRQWLLGIDLVRPSFTVVETEVQVTLALAGHPLTLRIDRVDRLPDGRLVVVDYKTGLGTPAQRWLVARPEAPQLALYALALGQERVAALAFAQLKPGQVKPVGLADDPATWPGLPTPPELKRMAVADWDEAQGLMRTAIEDVGRGVHEGDARILPRDAKVCGRCELLPLCRRAAFDEGDEADEGEVEGTA